MDPYHPQLGQDALNGEGQVVMPYRVWGGSRCQEGRINDEDTGSASSHLRRGAGEPGGIDACTRFICQREER
jgi:hypothetical protein